MAINPLSVDQQIAIAIGQLGSAGEKMLDDARRTAGVRELVTIPLYLSALLASGTQPHPPTTKEELLRLFVEEHERKPENAEALQESLLGCHLTVLLAIASYLNATASTTMTEKDARRIVSEATARQIQEGQIVEQPEPLRILEVLASYHTLMLSSGPNRTVGFQHQQFQEWYASHEVVALMEASARGDVGARVRLRAAILDQQSWEESLLFATERQARAPAGAAIVAHVVRLAMAIDPMLAAEVIFRSSRDLWEIIKEEIVSFAERWHRPETVDRAVRFMITTGRPEFAGRIWPLASNPNSQIQIPALRIAPHFRPSVLGENIGPKVAALAEDCRRHFLTLVAAESGIDGMDLATELASADPSPRVQADVVEYLLFRRAERHAASLLVSAHDETWAILAARGYADETRDQAIRARLNDETRKLLAASTDPVKKIGLLIHRPEDPERDAGIIEAISDARFPVNAQEGGTSLHLAQQRAPAAVLQGLRARLQAGLALPFHAKEFLAQLHPIDDGPVTAAILDENREDRDVDFAAAVAGPKTVNGLLDKFLKCVGALKSDRGNRAVGGMYRRLQARLRSTRSEIFLEAIVSRAALL